MIDKIYSPRYCVAWKRPWSLNVPYATFKKFQKKNDLEKSEHYGISPASKALYENRGKK